MIPVIPVLMNTAEDCQDLVVPINREQLLSVDFNIGIVRSLKDQICDYVSNLISQDPALIEILATYPTNSTSACREMVLNKLIVKGKLTCSLLQLIAEGGMINIDLSGANFSKVCGMEAVVYAVASVKTEKLILRNFTPSEHTSVFSYLSSPTRNEEPTQWTSLTHLDIRDCHHLHDSDINGIAGTFSNLKLLYLKGCTGLSGDAMIPVCRAQKLQDGLLCLDVSHNEISAVTMSQLPLLTGLTVLYASRILSEASVSFHGCGVTELDISGSASFTDEDIGISLVNHLKTLLDLNLAETRGSSATILASFHAASFQLYSQADNSATAKFADGATGGDEYFTEAAAACWGVLGKTSSQKEISYTPLRSLDLSWCDEVTGPDVAAIAAYCPSLTSLRLRSTAADSACVVRLASLCTALTELNLARCCDINDEAALALAANSSSLLSLDLSWSLITDTGLDPLLRAHNRLQILNLQGCKSLTVNALAPFLDASAGAAGAAAGAVVVVAAAASSSEIPSPAAAASVSMTTAASAVSAVHACVGAGEEMEEEAGVSLTPVSVFVSGSADPDPLHAAAATTTPDAVNAVNAANTAIADAVAVAGVAGPGLESPSRPPANTVVSVAGVAGPGLESSSRPPIVLPVGATSLATTTAAACASERAAGAGGTTDTTGLVCGHIPAAEAGASAGAHDRSDQFVDRPPPCPPRAPRGQQQPLPLPRLKFLDLSWINMMTKELAIAITERRRGLTLLDYYGEVYREGRVVADYL